MLEISTDPDGLRPLRLVARLGFMLCIIGSLAAGCGDGTGSGGAGGTGGMGSASSSKSTTASSSSASSSSATSSSSGQTLHSVTFTVDTTTKADGTKELAKVLTNEKVFLAGAFNGWNPQDDAYAMMPIAGKDGQFTITLTFPRDASDGTRIDTGALFEYKFAKTTDKATDPWGNGMKDYSVVDATHRCTNDPTQTSGLFEVENLKLTIPATNMDVTHVVEAWRDYAESQGYKTCN